MSVPPDDDPPFVATAVRAVTGPRATANDANQALFSKL